MTKDYGKGRGAKNRIAKADRKAAWNQAMREGRLVRFVTSDNDMTMRSFPTPEAAATAAQEAREAGLAAAIVDPGLAE